MPDEVSDPLLDEDVSPSAPGRSGSEHVNRPLVVGLVMEAADVPLVLPDHVLDRVKAVGRVVGPQIDATALPHAHEVEVLLTGWGSRAITPDVLAKLPSLRAIVHWGGGVEFVDPIAWMRGIVVSSAGWANAIPVAEWTIAMITLAAKDAFWLGRRYCRDQRPIDRRVDASATGLQGATVGVVGASRIGSRVIDMLRGYDVERLLYDPYCSDDDAARLGVELVPTLHELASRCRILTLHAPSVPSTRGMITRGTLAALPDGATLLNTARGALVDQDALIDEVRTERLRAILDVTEPDVLPRGHPLYDLPNVFLTPHLAGSTGSELHRLGIAAVEEIERFRSGAPLEHRVGPGFG